MATVLSPTCRHAASQGCSSRGLLVTPAHSKSASTRTGWMSVSQKPQPLAFHRCGITCCQGQIGPAPDAALERVSRSRTPPAASVRCGHRSSMTFRSLGCRSVDGWGTRTGVNDPPREMTVWTFRIVIMSVPESPPMRSGRRRTRFAGPHAQAARLVGVPSADVGTPRPTSPATWDQALVTVTGYPLVFVVGLGTRCWTW